MNNDIDNEQDDEAELEKRKKSAEKSKGEWW